MTQNNVQITLSSRSLLARIDLYFASLGLGFNPSRLRRTRLRDIAGLDAKSDEDLAAMGLRREDICGYVFRDLLTG